MPPLINPTQIGAFARDDNAVPIANLGLVSTDSQSLTANNTTVSVPIFSVTGTVQINAIYGVVTTALSSNITAAYWRLNDGTAQSNITLNTGTTLSSATVGSVITKAGLAAAALALISASQERVTEPTTLETVYFSPFIATQKTGGVATNIEFTYSTTNTPATGAIQFFVCWLPLSSGSKVTPL